MKDVFNAQDLKPPLPLPPLRLVFSASMQRQNRGVGSKCSPRLPSARTGLPLAVSAAPSRSHACNARDSFYLDQRSLEKYGTRQVTIRMEEATSDVVTGHVRLLNNRPHVIFRKRVCWFQSTIS
jgi:hypothetical protein